LTITFVKKRVSILFQKMLRRAGIVKEMATDPLYVKKIKLLI